MIEQIEMSPTQYLNKCLAAYRAGTFKCANAEEEAYLLLWEAKRELKVTAPLFISSDDSPLCAHDQDQPVQQPSLS